MKLKMIFRSVVYFLLNALVLACVPSLAQGAGKPLSVIAYLPEYRIDSVEPRQLQAVTELIYFGIEPTEDGTLLESSIQPGTLEKLQQLQETSGCSMLLTVGGWGRSEHFPVLASNAAARKRFISSLKSLCLSRHFSGVDYDWEHPKDEKEIDAYATLLEETRASFQAQGLKVTVAQASWQDLGEKAYEAVDRVHLMSYDHDYPQATLEQSIADVNRLIQFGCPTEKIALGLPFYGRVRNRDAKTYRELIANAEFDPAVDEIKGYAFNGRQTISQKIDFALHAKLQGVMIWEIGQDSYDPETSLLQCIQNQIQSNQSQKLHAFYYPWYGNPETEGDYVQWNHAVAVRQGPPRSFPGGDDIGANFYPALGCYSNNDDGTLTTHMKQLKQAGVGVISVSWWGKDSFTDKTLPRLFRVAGEHGIKINFHFEPRLGPGGRNASMVRDGLVYLIDRFGEHPALYRDPKRGNRPMIYLYDSYLTKAEEWATILAPGGINTIRGTPYDTVVIGLWVKKTEERFFLDGHFDGFYTYFASDGFTYGSTTSHWSAMQAWAREHHMLFIPCVAPGYKDTRIRPWNGRNTRRREQGNYYDHMFEAAINVHPELIAITSFNEWHEGTQIEPAVPKKVGDYQYEDYLPHPPDWYLNRTAYWLEKFNSVK